MPQQSAGSSFPMSLMTLVSFFTTPLRVAVWWVIELQLWLAFTAVSWTSAFVTFPFRVIVAAYREKKIEAELEELRVRCNYWRESVVGLQESQQQLVEEAAVRQKERQWLEARLAKVLMERAKLKRFLEESIRQLEEQRFLAQLHLRSTVDALMAPGSQRLMPSRPRLTEIKEAVEEGEEEEREAEEGEEEGEGESTPQQQEEPLSRLKSRLPERSCPGRMQHLAEHTQQAVQQEGEPANAAALSRRKASTEADAASLASCRALAVTGASCSLLCLAATAVLVLGAALSGQTDNTMADGGAAASGSSEAAVAPPLLHLLPSLLAAAAFTALLERPSARAAAMAARCAIPLLLAAVLLLARLGSRVAPAAALEALLRFSSGALGQLLAVLLAPNSWLALVKWFVRLLERSLNMWLAAGAGNSSSIPARGSDEL